MITFTKTSLPYGWLGNMSNHPVFSEEDGLNSRNAEAYFQALRFPKGSSIRRQVSLTSNPMAAKKRAKANQDQMNVQQLGRIDVEIMVYVVGLKLQCNPELVDLLLRIPAETEIVEDVTNRIGDKHSSSLFWGKALMGQNPVASSNSYWVGYNYLGEIWKDWAEAYREGPEQVAEDMEYIRNKLVAHNVL